MMKLLLLKIFHAWTLRLVRWMDTFPEVPTQEIKADHMEGYCVCTWAKILH